MNKIFCIGLNRTGTTSLHRALQIMGFKSVHYRCEQGNIKDIVQANFKSHKMLLADIEDYDAYSDWNRSESNCLFKVFDKQYPDSKFILTIRNLKSWLKSRDSFVRKTIPDLDLLQKQNPQDPWYNCDKKAWAKEWAEHVSDVSSYFKNRPGDLLIMNITAGEGWDTLCPFLGKPKPTQPFPHEEKGNYSGA